MTTKSSALFACARAIAQDNLQKQSSKFPLSRYYLDHVGLIKRFHSLSIHKEQLPDEIVAAALFTQFMHLRCDLIGAKLYPGIDISATEFYGTKQTYPPLKMIWLALVKKKFGEISEQMANCLLQNKLDQFAFGQQILKYLDNWLEVYPYEINQDQQAVVEGNNLFANISENDNDLQEDTKNATLLEDYERGNLLPIFRTIDYSVHDSTQDLVIEAANAVKRHELDFLNQQFAALLTAQQKLVQRMAKRLQKRIQECQRRYWQFDLEEGIIDRTKLSQVVISKSPYIYKTEREGLFQELAFTILLDNSGSMRGESILHATLCLDVVVKVLEKCNIATEVLGYTTRYSKPAVKKFKKGRLNSLLHVIYKSFHQQWRRVRHGLVLPLKGTFLKENIDGEALQWAYARLLKRPEKRKLLLVIADGKPFDDATVTYNGKQFLDNHLHQVIQKIETNSPVQLAAIGLDYIINQYYTYSLVIDSVSTLEVKLIDFLEDWILGKK